MRKVITMLVLTAMTAPALAGTMIVTLSVPTMDCAVCPITVKRALLKVAGVSEAVVNFDRRQAIVTFDDARTGVEVLTRATREAGYPSSVAIAAK